jgi:hypothetical protein
MRTIRSAPVAKSTTERVAELRARLRKAGFRLLQVWVHPGDRERVKAFVARLTARRAGRP